MLLKQLSVFIENRVGRLEEVTEVLAKNKVNITTFSLADTSEYGLLRMIVDNPLTGRNVLKEAGFSAMLTDVVAIKLPHEIGALNQLTTTLRDVNVEYIYVLSTGNNPSIIVKTDDAPKTVSILENNGFELFSEEAYTIN